MKLDVEEEFSLEEGMECFEEGEGNVPPSTEMVPIEKDLLEVIEEPLKIRELVRRKYTLPALVAYDELLQSSDQKVKKATADSILEIADVKVQKNSQMGSQMVNFNLGAEAQGLLLGALGALAGGEIIQQAEIVEEGEK